MARQSKRLAGESAPPPLTDPLRGAPKKPRNEPKNEPKKDQKNDDVLEKMKKKLKECKAELATEKRKNAQLLKEKKVTKTVQGKKERMSKRELNSVKQTLIKQNKVVTKERDDAIKKAERLSFQCEIHAGDPKFQNQLRKQRETTKTFRKKFLELTEQMRNNQEAANGEPFPWRFCEICADLYTHELDRTPRVLGCGHTLCLGCVKTLASESKMYIKCPFDRFVTKMGTMTLEQLPKNYTILNM